MKAFTGPVNSLALSPDGTRLAYLSYETGDNEIYTLNLVTGQNKRLTHDSHSDVDPAWSPDGSKIAFTSSRSGQFQVYTMQSFDGSLVFQLTSKSKGVKHPTWYR